jgi:serine/threonine-protein kinase
MAAPRRTPSFPLFPGPATPAYKRGVLGKGAMGTVYEGFDPIIARRVAIKTLKLPEPDDHEAQDELARFKREAQAAGRLSHPNIVGVFDYGETQELAYIVMELVDGTSLKQVIDKKERFELADIVRLMESLMAGLQYSHDRGVVHRDIKPANIMLTKANELKISDFGIARIESSSMTQAGTVLGTPAYMSPEQFMGQTVDSRTDIYSSGVLLYQLLTGEKPFEGGLTAIMHKVLNTEPPAPSALSVTVPHAFDAVVKQAMAKRPEDRFSAANDFARAVREAFSAKPPAPVVEQNFSIGDFGDGDATLVTTARPPPVQRPSAAAAPAALPLPPPAAKKGPPVALLGIVAAVVLAIIAGAAVLLLGHHGSAPVAQTSPAPAPSPTPAPAPMPAPAPTPAPTPAAPPAATPVREKSVLTDALGAVPCTLLSVSAATPPTVTGYVTAGTGSAALEKALAAIPAANAPADGVQTVSGSYCKTLDAIRPYAPLYPDAANNLSLGLAGGLTTLRENDPITVDGTVPAFTKSLEIDYFSNDGTVYHFTPKLTGGASLTMPIGEAGPPFGTDLIVAIAATAPLFAAPRAQGERRSDYLPALRQALANVVSTGGQISVAALPVITEPAPPPPDAPPAVTQVAPNAADTPAPLPAPLPRKLLHKRHDHLNDASG